MAKPPTVKVKATEIAPGVLALEGVRFNGEVAAKYFSPLVGKTIVSVQLQEDPMGGSDPEIVLNFNDGSAAAILQDPEGNGPGFIEYLKA